MKIGFGFLIGIGLGIISSYFICALMASEISPSKWDSGIKAFASFIIIFCCWAFTLEDI